MTLLNKSQILGAQDRKFEDVEVPEWGGTVRITEMSGAQRDAYESSIVSVDDKGARSLDRKNLSAKLLAACIVDDQGQRLFTEGDIDALSEKCGSVISRLWEKAAKLNRLTDNAVEDAAKN